MRPLLRPPPAATPTVHPGDPVQPIAHDRPLDPGSAVRQSVPPAGHSALFCPSGVVLLSVVFVDLPWEATPPHFYSVPGTRSFAPMVALCCARTRGRGQECTERSRARTHRRD